jgi:pSer/pThr/pTyr-binding forkhead associated (FHA) protein/DNA-binding CsgD family transcriptional regulator
MLASTTAEKGQACLKWGGGMLSLSGPCVIGRRSDNDLQINNVQVSRRHALLMNHNDDWWLNDLGSRNGVLVNGMRLTSARRLRDGDEIRIANHRITFCNSSQTPPHHSSIVGKTTQVATPASDEMAPAAVTCELIIATAEGEILEGEKAAHWFFGKTLERAPGAAHYILPSSVRQWLERLATEKGVSAALELHQGERRLIMSLARCKADHFFLLVREDKFNNTGGRLQNLGVTTREAEVLHWICEGKQNPEIAELLHLSTHTVNRHVEHILKKLGVDNRQKAIKAVMDRLAV